MPKLLFLIIALIIGVNSSIAQDSLSFSTNTDTIYIKDTIIETKTIKKIVYIYGPPKIYSSIGLHISPNVQFYNKNIGENRIGNGVSIGINYKHCKNKFLIESGITYSYNSWQIAYNHINTNYFPVVKMKIDTLSWYSQIIQGREHLFYITDTSYYNATDSSFVDSLVNYSNSYQFISIPVQIGYQLCYGFLTLYIKVGINPGLLINTGNNNKVLNTKNEIQKEHSIQTFNCNTNVEISFSYLLTLKTQLHLDINYNYSLLSYTHSNELMPMKRNELGIKIGISHIFSSK